MTETEYNKITADYLKETKRWQDLRVGQSVYQSNEYLDWFEHEIIEIDVPNRKLTCIDHSLKHKPVVVISHFWLREEIR